MPTINELSLLAGAVAQAMSIAAKLREVAPNGEAGAVTQAVSAGLNRQAPILVALASGFDVALSLLEQSTGARFSDLTPEAAERVVKYFRDEAVRSEAVDPQVAIFYRSWAEVLATTYLRP
jgi:hypothetical protein